MFQQEQVIPVAFFLLDLWMNLGLWFQGRGSSCSDTVRNVLQGRVEFQVIVWIALAVCLS